jgi:hypothetical protein
MKSAVGKALSVTLLQVCIVGSLAGKYAHDRATCPRAWVKTAYYDPDLPIRGRYASLQLEVEAPGVFTEKPLVEDRHNETPAAKAAEPCAGAITEQATTPQQKVRYVQVWDSKAVRLELHDRQLFAVEDPNSTTLARFFRDADGKSHVTLEEPVDFYVPEHAANLPGWQWPRTLHTEWWAEVTLPKKGPPRPIRLGIKQTDGHIMPLPVS